MKLKTLALAASTACCALSASAAGLLPTDYVAASTQDYYLSGATAQDNGILGMARSLCASGSLSQYNISNNNVYFCSPDVGGGAGQITLPAGKTKVAFYKYSVGGSGSGIDPVANATALGFLDLTKLQVSGAGANCTTVAPDFTDTALPAYTKYSCATNASHASITSNQTPKIGFSDMEPAFFTGSATDNKLTKQSVTSLIFGVPVSKKVRDKLQAYQGKTVGGETEADMPSLTSAQLTSIYTQAGQTWSGIGYDMTNSGVGGPVLSDDGIYVARRAHTSGTQKTFEALVAGTPNGQGFKSCLTGTDPFVGSDSGNDLNGDASESVCASATPPLVFAGNGGGNVRGCITNHDTAGRGAVGILTTEDKQPAATSNTWRFVAVDGVAPTQKNVASGAYRLYTENTFQYLPSTNVEASNPGYPALIARLKADLNNPTIIAALNSAYVQNGGWVGGLLALGSNQASVPPIVTTDAAIKASPINPWTKLVSGSTLNNCQKPKAIF